LYVYPSSHVTTKCVTKETCNFREKRLLMDYKLKLCIHGKLRKTIIWPSTKGML